MNVSDLFPLTAVAVLMAAGVYFACVTMIGHVVIELFRAQDRRRSAERERDRLASIVRRYDRCRCGWFRHHHEDGRPIACRGFDQITTADDGGEITRRA